MKFKSFLFTAAVSAAVAYGFMHSARKLALNYNKKTGRLFIDLAHRMRCCTSLVIETMVVSINGEVAKTFEFADDEKPFNQVFFIDLPEVETGDLIEVKMTTKCSRIFSKAGKIEIE